MVMVNAAPVLTLAKEFVDLNGGAVHPGDILEYSISYANVGNADASGVFILDDYSNYIASISDITTDANFTSYDDNGDYIIWPDTGSIVLPVSESGTISYNGHLTSSFPTGTTQVTNTAVIFSNETGPIDGSTTATVRISTGVGGIIHPTNKTAIVMPWVLGAVAVALVLFSLRPRRNPK